MEIGVLNQEDGYATCAAIGADAWVDEVNSWEDPETQSFNALDQRPSCPPQRGPGGEYASGAVASNLSLETPVKVRRPVGRDDNLL